MCRRSRGPDYAAMQKAAMREAQEQADRQIKAQQASMERMIAKIPDPPKPGQDVMYNRLRSGHLMMIPIRVSELLSQLVDVRTFQHEQASHQTESERQYAW